MALFYALFSTPLIGSCHSLILTPSWTMDTDSVADWTSGGMGVEEDLVFAKITHRLIKKNPTKQRGGCRYEAAGGSGQQLALT